MIFAHNYDRVHVYFKNYNTHVFLNINSDICNLIKVVGFMYADFLCELKLTIILDTESIRDQCYFFFIPLKYYVLLARY